MDLYRLTLAFCAVVTAIAVSAAGFTAGQDDWTIIIGVIALLGITVAMVIYPVGALGVVLTCAPGVWALSSGWSADLSGKHTNSVNAAVVLGALVTLRYGAVLFAKVDKDLNFVRMAILAYVLSLLPSMVAAPSMPQAAGVFLRQISPLVLFFAVVHYSTTPAVAHMLRRCVLDSAIVFGAVLLAAYLTGNSSTNFGGISRLRAFALSPQHVSFYSVALVAFGLASFIGARNAVMVGFAFAFSLAAYATGFRTAWLGILVFLVVLATSRRASAPVRVLVIAGGLLTMVGYEQVLGAFGRKEIGAKTSVQLGQLDAVSSGRLRVTAIALREYERRPIVTQVFGAGLESTYDVVANSYLGIGYNMHNDYLATLVDSGIIALGGYLLVLGSIGKMLWRAQRTATSRWPAAVTTCGFALFVAAAAMAVFGAWYANVFAGWYVYSMFGLAIAFSRIDAVNRALQALMFTTASAN